MQHHLQLSGHNKTELIFIDPSILEKYRVKKGRHFDCSLFSFDERIKNFMKMTFKFKN
jgi:hypothetical protein